MRPVEWRRVAWSIRASIWKVSSLPRKRASAAFSNSSVKNRGVHLRENKSGSIRSIDGKSIARLCKSYLAAQRVQRARRLVGRCGDAAFAAGGARGGGRTEFRRRQFRADRAA